MYVLVLDVDVCSQIECINGVCEEVNGIYQCTCNTGWEGLTCNTSKLKHVYGKQSIYKCANRY